MNKIVYVFLITLSLSFIAARFVYSSSDFDLNNDGIINKSDFTILVSDFGKSGSLADFNNNGIVDIFDFSSLVSSFGSVATQTPPPAVATDGIWISQSELAALPTSGTAWNNLRSSAYGNWGSVDLVNQDNKHDIGVLAGALVYAKTGDQVLREKVRQNIMPIIGDETGARTLSLGRQLGAYVIAADLINLKDFTADDQRFRIWLAAIRTKNIGGHSRWYTLNLTCEDSANNWGTFACASRIAASAYLGDTADLERVSKVFRAWLGERQYYPSNWPANAVGYFLPSSDFNSSWTCNSNEWTAINPACTKSGVNLDGAIVEDLSRGGGCCTAVGSGISYAWEVMQGVYVSAELLNRQGYDIYNWSNKALLRAMDFMKRSAWSKWPGANYTVWMANKRYGTNYPAEAATTGRIMSWTDWTHPQGN